MLREELWVRPVRLEGSSSAPVPASVALAVGMAVMAGYEMTCERAREKMCAVNVSVEAVIASGPETLRSSQVGDAVATAAAAAGREARAVATSRIRGYASRWERQLLGAWDGHRPRHERTRPVGSGSEVARPASCGATSGGVRSTPCHVTGRLGELAVPSLTPAAAHCRLGSPLPR